MNKILFTIITVLILMPLFSLDAGEMVLDHTVGIHQGKAKPDVPLKFYIRMHNNNSQSVAGCSNGYRIYVTNNGEILDAQFVPVTMEMVFSDIDSHLDLFNGFSFFFDGFGSDTVGFGGSKLTGPGIPVGFNDILYSISTEISSDYAGDTICLDSAFYPPSGSFLWSPGGVPDWSGPHCFEILPSCCVGFTGNYDNSDDDVINVSDIEVLIGYMFRMEPAPVCMEEADMSGDGMVDVADLVYFINYAFFGGPQPVDCP